MPRLSTTCQGGGGAKKTSVMFQNFFLRIFSRITSCDEGINSFSAGPDTLLCGLLSKSVQVFSRSAVGVEGGKETAKHLAMGDNHIFGLAQVLDRHTVFSDIILQFFVEITPFSFRTGNSWSQGRGEAPSEPGTSQTGKVSGSSKTKRFFFLVKLYFLHFSDTLIRRRETSAAYA